MRNSSYFLFLFCCLIGSSAFGAKDNQSFLNGKPFSSLSDRIEANRAAIAANSALLDSTRDEMSALSEALSSLTDNINSNSNLIDQAFAAILATNGDVSLLAGDVLALETTVTQDIDAIDATLSAFDDELADLNLALGQLQADVTAANAALLDAVASNAGDIDALTTQAALMNGSLVSLQGDYIALQQQVASLNNLLASQSSELTNLTNLVSALDIRLQTVEAGGGGSGSVRQFELVDHPDTDDLTHQDVVDGLLALNMQPGEFIHVRGEGSYGLHEVCTDSADVLTLIDDYTSNTFRFSSYTDGFGRVDNGSWASTSRVYLLSRNIVGDYGPQIYFMAFEIPSARGYAQIGTAADNVYITPNWESFVVGFSSGMTQTLTYTVAPTRMEACGF